MSILDTFYILFDTDAKKAEREMADLRGESAKTADAIDDSVKGARQLAPAIDKAADNAGKLGRSFKGVIGLIGAAGLTAGVYALNAALQGTVEEADRLIDASARIRLGAQDFDTWRRAVKASGGELADAEAQLEAYDTMLRRIQAGIGKRGVEALAALGLSATDADGNLKDVRTSLLEVAGALEGLEKTKQLAAIRRLGITDEGTIKLLLQGRTAIEALSEEQLRNGAITQEQANRIDKYKESSEQLQGVLQGWKFTLVSAIAPALATVNGWLVKGAQWMRENAKFVEGLGIAFAIAGTVITASFLPAIWSAAAGVIAATWPILLAVAAIAALGIAFALAYEDVMAFLNGQDSLIGSLMGRYGWFRALVEGLAVAFRVLGRVAVAVFNGLVGATKATADFLVSAFRTWYSLTAPIFGLFRDVAVAVFGFVAKVFVALITPWVGLARIVFGGVAAAVRSLGDVFGAVFGMIGRWWDATIGKIIQGINIAVNGARRLMGLPVSDSANAAAMGQGQLARAAASPFASQTAASVTSNSRTNRTQNINMGGVTVNTRSTDPAGVGNALTQRYGDVAAQFDDGIDR